MSFQQNHKPLRRAPIARDMSVNIKEIATTSRGTPPAMERERLHICDRMSMILNTHKLVKLARVRLLQGKTREHQQDRNYWQKCAACDGASAQSKITVRLI